MFCTKCGAEIQAPAKFCPKCGTPVEGAAPASNPAPAQNPAPGTAYRAAAPNPAPVYTAPAAAPKGKVKFGVNTLLGIIGAFMAFIGMFTPFLTATVSMLGMSQSQSATYVELMEEGDAPFMTMLALGCLAWVVLFHLLKMPKVSLIGVAGLIFGIVVIIAAYADVTVYGARLSYSIGFWIHAAGIIVCIVAAFLKKNRE